MQAESADPMAEVPGMSEQLCLSCPAGLQSVERSAAAYFEAVC